MESFSISQIAPSVWPFAIWPSTSQKVAANRHGTFYLVSTASSNPAAAYPTTFTLFWDSGSGPTAVWSAALSTNMATLVAFESGEVHVVYSNFSAGTIVDFCWPDVSASTTPNTATTAPGFGSAGKTGAVADDARRCIHVAGLGGSYGKFNASGAWIAQQSVFGGSGSQAEYFDLVLDDADNLYISVMTATSASPPEYDSVSSVMTPDAGDIAPAWYSGSLAQGAALTTPLSPASGVLLTLGEQARRNNNLLIGSTVFDGSLHALICETPGISERPYVYDDFRDLTVESVSVKWSNAAALRTAEIHRPLKGQTLFPKCAAGGICQRASGLYAVVHDRTNLIALKSSDCGKSWQDYAETSLLPYLGSGTDASTWWTPRDLGIMRGDDQDTDIIGMFTIMGCSPSAWSSAPSGFCPPSSTYSFSLPTP